MNRQDKPKMTSEQLVQVLKEKGITFNLVDENTAVEYLKDVNNYLRSASYRRNFEKYQMGVNKGKYIRVDFGYLIELSTIDMHLRSILLQMCIDLEHAIKTRLISTVEANPFENGYSIVDLFLLQNDNILSDIENKIDTIFTGKLIDAYFTISYVYYPEVDSNGFNRIKLRIIDTKCPIWVLVELLSFGDLLKLVYFYNNQYPDFVCNIPKYSVMAPVKSLRNACAHNNCLLSDMRPSNETKPNAAVISFIMKSVGNYSSMEIHKKLSCRPIFEIVSLLNNYISIVSPKIRANGISTLREFTNTRMLRNPDYFINAKEVLTSFLFIQKVLDSIPES